MKQSVAYGAAALLLAQAIAGATAHAQTGAYPTRPIRLLVPYAPGGSSDAIGRILGQKMGDALGQQLVIDNRAGAASVIGRELAAKAVPDGYTLLLGDAVHTINVHVLKSVPYHPVNDFTFITLIGFSPTALAVHPTGVQSLKEFIAQARAQPGRINYGMGGNGSITHLTGELFKTQAHVNLTAIPYKSIGLAVNDLLGAQIQAAFPSLPPTVAHVRAGRLRVLAVASEKRVSALAEAPTFAEAGVQGMVVSNWFGLMGPPRLPAPIVSRLHAEAVKAIQAPDVREKFAAMALELVANQPAEFRAIVEAELARWGKVVKQAGITGE